MKMGWRRFPVCSLKASPANFREGRKNIAQKDSIMSESVNMVWGVANAMDRVTASHLVQAIVVRGGTGRAPRATI